MCLLVVIARFFTVPVLARALPLPGTSSLDRQDTRALERLTASDCCCEAIWKARTSLGKAVRSSIPVTRTRLRSTWPSRVQEGDTDAAEPLLERPSNDPRLASAHYFAGLAFKADGNYPAAFDEFSQASALYPRDRVVRNQMGRMLFLERKYQDAVAEFDKTLAVDPEDLEAHYDLMLCYRGLRDDAQAAREEKLYLRFKADESSRAITGPYKLAHPEDNDEAQPIHEHVSVVLGEGADKRRYAEGGKRKKSGKSQNAEIRKQKEEPERDSSLRSE